jgi:putative transcriptional regulator
MRTKKACPPLYERLKQGLEEALMYTRGEMDLVVTTVEVPAPAPMIKPKEVIALRKDLRMSRIELARTLNISDRTLRSWEEGKKKPSSSALRLLQILKSEPELVSRALSSPPKTGAKRLTRSLRKTNRSLAAGR